MTQHDFDTIDAEQDGLLVTKEVEIAGDDVAHVRFTLRSEREGPASVRLVDEVPAAVPDGRVGLHPDYRERWTVEDRRLVFESTIDPGAEQTTLYGVNTGEPEEARAFLVTPDVALEAPAGPVAQSGGGTACADPFEPATVEDASVVDALVTELREGDGGRREELRDLLADDDAGRGSVDARVKHLQSTVADLEAYRDAMGAFLDEHGGAEEVIAEFEDDVAELRADLDRVRGDLEAATERLDDLADLSSTVEELRETVADLEAAHEDDTDCLSKQLDGLADEVATLREDIEAGRRWREGVAAAASEAPAAEAVDGASDPVPGPVDTTGGDNEEAGDAVGPEDEADDPLGDAPDGASDGPLSNVPE